MDINDAGPTLRAGRFAMRVTNVGVIGNAFFNQGLSSDPSFEFPADAGIELLDHGELWVGALNERGEGRVSGGPMLEWRPTLAADDRVIEAQHGRLGSRRFVDDDNDGRVDEEVLNHRDDDGDGEVDEDLGFGAQQMLAADYVDDRPEAVNYVYSASEGHQPFGLSVHQEAFAWSVPGYTGTAGLQFRIMNHGDKILRQVYVGFLADLDVRGRNERAGKSNDVVERRQYSLRVFEGRARTSINGIFPGDTRNPDWPDYDCYTDLNATYPIVVDGRVGTNLPVIALVPLEHTTDPIGFIRPQYARAPTSVSFRTSVFSESEFPGRGGLPQIDSDRYAALAGRAPVSLEARPDDYYVLVSCGPFATLAPGQALELAVALVAAENVDTLMKHVENAVLLHHGNRLNLLPDTLGERRFEWNNGMTGRNGHEICFEPPPGVTFTLDPHCGAKFGSDQNPEGPYSPPETYSAGHCIWTDLDCSLCTGLNGAETIARWLDPGTLPPSPTYRMIPGDHQIRIEWDNLPEILINAKISRASPGARFGGYRVYKLQDWRGRESLLPPRKNWALLAAFGPESLDTEAPLQAVTDTTLDYLRILYEQKLYPVGRYAVVDREVLNGFDYDYVVSSVSQEQIMYGGDVRIVRYESPLVSTFDRIVRPQASARPQAGQVWVVPNPYRASSHWDRPPVLGDAPTTHIDFMGLPQARSTIKIWTVAGDFVAQIEHDGTGGDGQASWDLISRNGQDIESGVYLFTVETQAGSQTGRFVVIR